MRRLVVLAALASLAAPALAAALVPGAAQAAPACRDAKGKFVKCPAAAPARPVRCKDPKGRFSRCDALGARPA